MKPIIGALIILFLSVGGCSKKEKSGTDLMRGNLSGNVKSIKETSYYAQDKFGEIIKGEIKSFWNSSEYNTIGNITETGFYYPDGRLYFKLIYKYGDRKQVIEVDNVDSKEVLSNKLLKKYNEQGNIIEENTYNLDGTLSSKLVKKYDDKGSEIEEDTYNSNGALSMKITQKNDDLGREIEENDYMLNGNLGLQTTIKYEGTSNKIREEYFNNPNDGTSHTDEYKYDNNGNRIERNIVFNGSGLGNSRGKYKYEFDSHKNWIKRIDFNNEMPEGIVEREIEYYK